MDPKLYREMLKEQLGYVEDMERALAAWKESMQRLAKELPTLDHQAVDEWQRQMAAMAPVLQPLFEVSRQFEASLVPKMKALHEQLRPQFENASKAAASLAPMMEAMQKAALTWAAQFQGLDKMIREFGSKPKSEKD